METTETDIPKNFVEKVIDRIVVVLKWVGSMFLALMMFLTAVDVACRYLFNSPIAGALELVEYMMAVVIPFSIAYCAFSNAHVAVEFIMDQFPKKIQKIIDLPMNILTVLFLLVIAWQSCLYTVEMYQSQMTSSVLLIAAYPFVIPVAIGMAIFALILLNELFSRAPKKEEK